MTYSNCPDTLQKKNPALNLEVFLVSKLVLIRKQELEKLKFHRKKKKRTFLYCSKQATINRTGKLPVQLEVAVPAANSV